MARSDRPRPVLVLLLPGFHALDFGGPVQAVFEATGFGAPYALRFVASHAPVRAAQGFCVADAGPLPEPEGHEWILVPGTESGELDELPVPTDWLVTALGRGARISSICSGAFALAAAGLLDGRRCTTHWKLIERLRRTAPTAEVLENRLYVQDGDVITSAGEAAGIDMALALIEADHGPALAAKVAREMVVYLRRSGRQEQRSIYLLHRAHVHPGVHLVQDWIQEHPDKSATLDELAQLAALSPRHLTRVFRQATGVTPKEFQHQVKLEVARQLLEGDLPIDEIATRCGFEDGRQLRRIWRREHGISPRETRVANRLDPPA